MISQKPRVRIFVNFNRRRQRVAPVGRRLLAGRLFKCSLRPGIIPERGRHLVNSVTRNQSINLLTLLALPHW